MNKIGLSFYVCCVLIALTTVSTECRAAAKEFFPGLTLGYPVEPSSVGKKITIHVEIKETQYTPVTAVIHSGHICGNRLFQKRAMGFKKEWADGPVPQKEDFRCVFLNVDGKTISDIFYFNDLSSGVTVPSGAATIKCTWEPKATNSTIALKYEMDVIFWAGKESDSVIETGRSSWDYFESFQKDAAPHPDWGPRTYSHKHDHYTNARNADCAEAKKMADDREVTVQKSIERKAFVDFTVH